MRGMALLKVYFTCLKIPETVMALNTLTALMLLFLWIENAPYNRLFGCTQPPVFTSVAPPSRFSNRMLAIWKDLNWLPVCISDCPLIKTWSARDMPGLRFASEKHLFTIFITRTDHMMILCRWPWFTLNFIHDALFEECMEWICVSYFTNLLRYIEIARWLNSLLVEDKDQFFTHSE